MKTIKRTSIFIFTLLILFNLTGCKEEPVTVNQNPTVIFIEPDINLVIEQDTILTIVFEADDEDGNINKVDLLINGTIVMTYYSPPYQYDYYNLKLENEGVHTFKVIAYDDKGATGEAKLSVEIKDYRTKYIGNFYFKVINASWSILYPTVYDTTFYSGEIRKYELMDSENDLYNDDDFDENQNEKITIEFKQDTKITSLLNRDGSLVSKSAIHYHHQGGFTNIDTIEFTIDGLGGLGGGNNYSVVGIRE